MFEGWLNACAWFEWFLNFDSFGNNEKLPYELMFLKIRLNIMNESYNWLGTVSVNPN